MYAHGYALKLMRDSQPNADGQKDVPSFWKNICEFMGPKFKKIVVEGTPTCLWDAPEPSKPTWGVSEAYLLSFDLRRHLAEVMYKHHQDSAQIGGQGFRQLEKTERVLPDWVPEGTDDDTLQNRWGSVALPIFCANALVGMPRKEACVVEDIDGSVLSAAAGMEYAVELDGSEYYVKTAGDVLQCRWLDLH